MGKQTFSSLALGRNKRLVAICMLISIAVMVSSFWGCSSSPTEPEQYPPQVTGLHIPVVTSNGVLLRWTAPVASSGPDPSYYQVRYDSLPLNTIADWNGATVVDGAPDPAAPGIKQQFEITGLRPRATYHFGVRVVGANGKASNTVQVTTGLTGDTIALKSFTLLDVDDSSHSCSEWVGHRLVVLNFWGIWCHYCVEEMPDLIQLYENYRDSDVVLIGLDAGDDKLAVRDFMATHGIEWLNLMATSAIQSNYLIHGYPTTIFLGPDGREVGRRVGKASYETYECAVNYLLARGALGWVPHASSSEMRRIPDNSAGGALQSEQIERYCEDGLREEIEERLID